MGNIYIVVVLKYNTMKTLGITKELRADIREVSVDGESVDACLNRLLDEHVELGRCLVLPEQE